MTSPKTVTIDELEAWEPRLREALAAADQWLLVSDGETVARILPFAPTSVPSDGSR